MTLNMYLNTVPVVHHGATRFLSSTLSTPLTVLAQSQPTLGSAALFRDDLWHDGEELLEGKKWLLRTDVMFQRERGFDWERFCKMKGWVGEGHGKEKGRKALWIAEGLEDAGCNEEAVNWYKVAFREWPELERGG